MNIGTILTNLREEHGITQVELAEKLNINRSVLNRIELGTRPARDSEVVKIANYFHVSTDYLLGNDDTPPAQTKQPANTISILTDAEIKLALQIRNLPESDQETIQLIASKTKKKAAEEPPKLKAAV